MEYDFQTLSPDDFERLIADLFSAEWGGVLESYKAGKDSGVDILHSRIISGEPRAVLQCKRYPANGFGQLFRSFKKELDKVRALNPERYVIVTSVALSNLDKNKLVGLMKPWVKGTGDIYGASEINTMLKRHPQVVRANFKLWISSTESLEVILHSRIFNLTNFTLDEMKSEMCKIVLHDGYDRALGVLKEKHHCIIAGNPGIGKTTLAKILLCHYVQEGFEPVVVHNDISDAWSLMSGLQAGRKLAVLYDDFLGQTRYDQLKFGKNEDAQLIRLIQFAQKNSNVRFILTSREYIIADARLAHGVFDSNVDAISRCTINLMDYSEGHRAKVLFNHLYFSNLPGGKVRAIVNRGLHKLIIEHKHFNPRIVAAICNRANSESLEGDEFLKFVELKLNDPSEIWAAPFNNEIMPLSRWVLAVLWSLGGAAELEVLKEAVLSLSDFAFEAERSLDFKRSLRELAENFISSEVYPYSKNMSRSITMIAFQNPSIADYMESFLLEEIEWVKTIAGRAVYFAQYQQILQILTSVPSEDAAIISNDLLARNEGVSGRAKGDIYRGSTGDLIYTDVDLFSGNDRTLTFLKIASFTPDWGRKYGVEREICNAAGWEKYFNGLASRGSVPYSVLRLVKWVRSSAYWREYEPKIRAGFHRAFIDCISSQPDWCEELSTLNLLYECLELLDIELGTVVKIKIQSDANAAANSLLMNEDDIQRLEEAADHLESFQKRMKFGVRQLVVDIREKAESKYLRQQDDVSRVDEAVSKKDKEELDIDLMFSELLH